MLPVSVAATPTPIRVSRTAILAAKNENMPTTTSNAHSPRTGQLEGRTNSEEVTFEGYGPGGVGMLIQVVTRTATAPW